MYILCDLGIYICYDGNDFENIKMNIFKMEREMFFIINKIWITHLSKSLS